MKKIHDTIHSKRFKHIMHAALAVLVVGWGVFRFCAVASENARQVFNASRVAADVGVPVHAMRAEYKTGTLYEPLSVQNNRAYVTGARAKNLRAGGRVGSGEIVSVSRNLDLETGMFVVRTRGVADGLHYAEFSADGFFVPLYAVRDNTVLVAVDGVATPRAVTVARQDSETAYITSGLGAGDIVILSDVTSGDKVQLKSNQGEI